MSDAPHWKSIPGPAAGHVVRGEELERWLELTRSEEPRVRKRAVQHLCPCHVRAQRDAVWERILAMTDDADLGVRKAVVHALGDGSPRALQERIAVALEALREEPDAGLRRVVRRLLEHFRREGHVNIL